MEEGNVQIMTPHLSTKGLKTVYARISQDKEHAPLGDTAYLSTWVRLSAANEFHNLV